MAIGSTAKIDRNKKLVDLKQKMTFKNLAAMFNLSEARAKEIYYREVGKGKYPSIKIKRKKLSTGRGVAKVIG